jgi:hypothetical protein
MAGRTNIFIYQNVDYQTPLEFYDQEGPIDLTDYTFAAQIRKTYSSAKIADFSFVVVDAQNGKVEMKLSNAITKELSAGKYQYDVLGLRTTGEVTKLLEGTVFVLPTITRID